MLWNKILSTKDFEQFNEANYFRTLEIYSNEKEFTKITPTTIEEKMALIEVIQNRYAYFLEIPSLQEELATLNKKNLHKILNLMKSFDPSSKLTREDLHSFSSELFIILKGPAVGLLDYFTENKTALMSKRLYRVVQEELLLKGLKSIINQFPEKTRYSLIEKARIHINRIIRYKLVRFASLPLDLPFMDQVKIPDELLEKILLEGINTHSEELITLFKKQNMLDNYERFRKAYRTLAFAAAFSYFFEEDLERQKKEKLENDKKADDEKQEFIDNFNKLSELITDSSIPLEKTEIELKDEQYKRNIEKFKLKYHTNPSSEEKAEMKIRIYGR